MNHWQSSDLSPVLSAQVHPTTGVVTVTGRLTKPGLLPYASDESPNGKPTIVYRSAQEIFSPAYLATIKGSVISADHTFKKPGDPNSGIVTNAREGDGFVVFEAMMTDKAVANRVFDGTREVSAGYGYDFAPMTQAEISKAKAEFPIDWKFCDNALGSAVEWLRGFNFRNNHLTVVAKGRAGSACAIDESKMVKTSCEKCGHMTNTDMTAGSSIASSGEIEAPETAAEEAAEELNEEKIQKMFDQVVALMGQIQTAMNASDMAFDSKAFSADRAGYLGSVLTIAGIEATDLAFTDSVKLLQAYSVGYQASKRPAQATDRLKLPTIGRAESSHEPEELGAYKQAWNKLTGRVSSNVQSEIN